MYSQYTQCHDASEIQVLLRREMSPKPGLHADRAQEGKWYRIWDCIMELEGKKREDTGLLRMCSPGPAQRVMAGRLAFGRIREEKF